ncbi:MAG: ABC transporter substrate-binding protein [Methylophilaceae bacterium]
MKIKLFKFILIIIFLGPISVFSKEIIFGIPQNPQNINPLYARDAASEKITDLVYEKIFNYNEQYKLTSKFVSWKNINDLDFVFTAKSYSSNFSNGREVVLKDLYFSIKKNHHDPLSKYFEDLKDIQHISLDGSIIKIKLKKPDPLFVEKLSLPILPYDLDDLKIDLSKSSLGSNQFQIISNKPLILLRKDGQRIKFAEVKDPSVRALKLINKEIDLLQNDLSLPIINYLERHHQLKTLSSPGTNVSYIGFNHQHELLKDPVVRKAIAHAINREEIIKFFFNQDTQAASQILSQKHWSSSNLSPHEYNPQLSKNLLIDAGYKLPLKLEFKTSTDTFRIKIATILKAQLEAIGINLKIISLDWGTFFKDIQNGDFQLYSLTWVGLKSPDIYKKIFHSSMIPPFGLNRGLLQDEMIDNLIKESYDKKNWDGALEYIHQNVLIYPLWYEGNFMASLDSICDYQFTEDGSWLGLYDVRLCHD